MLKSFLLAAGIGSRLSPITDTIPKCLIPFAGRPLLDYWLELLSQAGCSDARVNTHAHAEKMRAFLQSHFPAGYPRVTESYEPTLLGSAGAIAANADFAEGASEVIIICADQISNVDLASMVAFHRQHGDAMTMLLYRVPNPQECGIVELDAEDRVVEFVEKPAIPKSNLANGGIYIVSNEAYREIANMHKFDLGFDVLPQFVGRARGWLWDDIHRDIGTHASLAKARAELAKAKLSVAKRRKPVAAVFLDRDGTVIEHVHHLTKPEDVRLVPGAGECLSRLHASGYKCVIVTNQSVVGRGMLTEEGLEQVHAEMTTQLEQHGAWVDEIYFCPFAPGEGAEGGTEHPNRKPQPGMLLQAAQDLNLDLSKSWMIGDMMSDALAGHAAGCLASILIEKTPQSTPPNAEETGERKPARRDFHVKSLIEATDVILNFAN
ncbi:HAD-IIIA family hydrolase [Schlesneria paludicola]|uniref:HAD-IIIA family hydrolase n=1 Tax=Schlesneria paludicola TaxID=360056 RepID=UPI00029B1EA3|nr:HAD-IIIA family hydrolase [Schlesneria paludicola]